VSSDEEPLELTYDTSEQYGLEPGDLVADDHGPCRALAEAFRTRGPRAFTAPSAAWPGTTNLIVLEPRVVTSWTQAPIDDDVDWPVSMTSQDGLCPEDCGTSGVPPRGRSSGSRARS
jgi:hypothetical protein